MFERVKYILLASCMAMPYFLVGLIITFVMALIYLEYFFDPCDATILSQNHSPNGEWSIIVYTVGCGATVPFNTQANLMPTGQKFTRLSEQRILSVRGLHDVKIRWPDKQTAEFIFNDIKEAPKREDVYLMLNSKNGLTIVYKYREDIK